MYNLDLWNQVEETDKKLVVKKRLDDCDKDLNTLSPILRIKRATEIFGVYGQKWGLRKISHSDIRLGSALVIGIVDAEFFYTLENSEISFQISNSTYVVRMLDGKVSVNFSYRKALETDTICKALSRLGFNADIYTDNDMIRNEHDEKNNVAYDGSEIVNVEEEKGEK